MIVTHIICDKFDSNCSVKFKYGDIYFQVDYHPNYISLDIERETCEFCITCFEKLIRYKLNNGLMHDLFIIEQRIYQRN